jgi:hypothetical protein
MKFIDSVPGLFQNQINDIFNVSFDIHRCDIYIALTSKMS